MQWLSLDPDDIERCGSDSNVSRSCYVVVMIFCMCASVVAEEIERRGRDSTVLSCFLVVT